MACGIAISSSSQFRHRLFFGSSLSPPLHICCSSLDLLQNDPEASRLLAAYDAFRVDLIFRRVVLRSVNELNLRDALYRDGVIFLSLSAYIQVHKVSPSSAPPPPVVLRLSMSLVCILLFVLSRCSSDHLVVPLQDDHGELQFAATLQIPVDRMPRESHSFFSTTSDSRFLPYHRAPSPPQRAAPSMPSLRAPSRAKSVPSVSQEGSSGSEQFRRSWYLVFSADLSSSPKLRHTNRQRKKTRTCARPVSCRRWRRGRGPGRWRSPTCGRFR